MLVLSPLYLNLFPSGQLLKMVITRCNIIVGPSFRGVNLRANKLEELY